MKPYSEKVQTIITELRKYGYSVQTRRDGGEIMVELTFHSGKRYACAYSSEELESMQADALPLIVSRINQEIRRYI